MARPASRSRRGRDEDEAPGRSGKYAPPPRSGPPAMILLLGGALVVVAAIVGIALATSGKKPPPPPPAPAPLPPPKKVEPPKPAAPERVPPKPLTVEEKEFLEGLFREAQPHIDEFRKQAKAGWVLKGKEDNDGANDAWIDAKHAFQKAVQIVSEGLEDEERFPPDRPGLDRFNGKLAAWQKEMSELPKVNVTR